MNQPAEKLAKRLVGPGGGAFDSLQMPFQQSDNGRHLLVNALVRFVHPEQALFQFRCAIQRLDSIMSHRASQRINEGRRKALAFRLEHAQVGKEVGLGASLLPTIEVVHLRAAVEQGASMSIKMPRISSSASLSHRSPRHFQRKRPVGEDAHGMRRVNIETQHELANFFQVRLQPE